MKTTIYNRLLIITAALVIVLAASACTPTSRFSTEPGSSATSENSFADLVITLERTACFGTCPVYELTITGDGTVVYQGTDFVEVKGKQTASLDQAQVQELVSAFEQAHFYALQDTYTNYDVTDNPSAIISITYKGESKTVNHYYGDKSAPQELYDLEAKIDEIVNSKKWTGN